MINWVLTLEITHHPISLSSTIELVMFVCWKQNNTFFAMKIDNDMMTDDTWWLSMNHFLLDSVLYEFWCNQPPAEQVLLAFYVTPQNTNEIDMLSQWMRCHTQIDKKPKAKSNAKRRKFRLCNSNATNSFKTTQQQQNWRAPNMCTFCGCWPRFKSIQKRAIFTSSPITATTKNFNCKCVAMTLSKSSIFALSTAPININFMSARRFFFLPLPRLPAFSNQKSKKGKNQSTVISFWNSPLIHSNGKIHFSFFVKVFCDPRNGKFSMNFSICQFYFLTRKNQTKQKHTKRNENKKNTKTWTTKRISCVRRREESRMKSLNYKSSKGNTRTHKQKNKNFKNINGVRHHGRTGGLLVMTND